MQRSYQSHGHLFVRCLPITVGIAYLFCADFFHSQRQITAVRGMCLQTSVGTNMESLLRENRVFPPSKEFSAKAHIGSLEQYEAMYQRSVEDPNGFWAEAAAELDWFQSWTEVQSGDMSHAKWFVGGKLNLSHNCVDRHA